MTRSDPLARARSLQIFAAHCALWFAAVGSLAQLGGTDIAISGQMELSRLIDLASTRLRLNIEYDPAALKGATTFRIEGKISDQELWLLLNRVLAARGFTTVRMPGESAYSVVKLADASNLAGIETLQAGAPPPGFKIAVVRIQHRPVKEIVDAIGKTLSKAGGGSIVPLGEAGLVLLAELGAAVTRESNVVTVVNGRRLAILLGWCKLIRHRPTWLIQLHVKPHPDWVLVARLNPDGAAVQDYCLLPGGSNAFKLGVRHRKVKERHFSNGLDPLLGLIVVAAAVNGDA